MHVNLAYGRDGIEVSVPDSARMIVPSYLPRLDNECNRAIEAMRHPIGTAPLREQVKPTDRVAIVISDITRPTPNHKIIPWLLDELNHVPRKNFVIINGTGSHRDNTQAELIQMLGDEVVSSVRVINNNAFDKSTQKYLGKSSTGAPIYLNKEYCESDFRIVTGFIEPHFFAGFSGGPKGIMPGIAGIETILHFHSAALIGDPLSTWGIIEGNPVQFEATEIALRCKPEFMFNVTLNGDKEITNIFAGDVIEAHRVGCEFVKEHAMVPCDEPFDIVLTTNGGYPLDQNLYQAVKGMSAAHQIVKPGGHIIVAAECSDGLPNHGNYLEILMMRETPEEILEMINNPSFSMFDQWQVQKQVMIQSSADVHVYSNLKEEDVKNAMLRPTDDIQKTIVELIANLGDDWKMAVMPLGPLTIPFVRCGRNRRVIKY